MKATYFTVGFHKSYLQWLQLINSIPKKWKFTIKQTGSDVKNLSTNKVTSVMYFETMFNANNSDWTKIFK